MMEYFSQKYITELKGLLDTFPHARFEEMIAALLKAYQEERRIFVMGNGGSATTASHWVCDVNKGCCLHLEKKFKMICLNDNVSCMMAYANDLSYEEVFVEQLKNFFVAGDVVIGISASGNSKNVLKAIDYGRRHGAVTVGLCGYDGGQLHGLVDIPLLAQMNDMQKVEDVHMIIVHIVMQRLMQTLGQEGGC